MNFKKLFRGPFLYIILAIAAVWIGSALIGMNGYQQVDTEVGLKMLSSGKVSQATIVDTDQRVDLTLTTADAKYGEQVQFYWVTPRGAEIVKAVNDATLVDGFNDDVPRENWILSTLGFLLPILLIGAFFWFMLSSMSGGGNRIMQFGKSKAKLVTKETPTVTFDDVAGVDEAVVELREIKDFLAEPA
jgi:cell division protease FtsH